MQLINQIQAKIATFKTREEAAKFFGISIQTLGKFQSGNGNLPLTALQKLIDDYVNSGKLIFRPEGKATTPETGKPTPKDETSSKVTKEEEPEGLDQMNDTPEPVIPRPESLEDAVRIIIAEAGKLSPDDLRAVSDRVSHEVRHKIALAVPTMPGVHISGANFLALAGNARNFRCATLKVEKGYTLEEAMNKLALAFLKDEGMEWLVYMHPETFVPFGKPDWFRRITKSPFGAEFLGINALERLCSNRDNQIVGAVYADPGANGRNETQIELEPRDDQDKAAAELVKTKGPQNKLMEVTWLGLRVLAVHKRALQKIIETSGKEAGDNFPFFVPGLDRLFSARRFGKLAKESNIPMKLDLAIHGVPWAALPVIAPTGQVSK